jgi:hypothetical protein
MVRFTPPCCLVLRFQFSCTRHIKVDGSVRHINGVSSVCRYKSTDSVCSTLLTLTDPSFATDLLFCLGMLHTGKITEIEVLSDPYRHEMFQTDEAKEVKC